MLQPLQFEISRLLSCKPLETHGNYALNSKDYMEGLFTWLDPLGSVLDPFQCGSDW